MIGLVNFLKAAGIEFNVNDLKIHLAGWNGYEHPIDEYYAGDFKEWQERQGKRNFTCSHVLSLIDIGCGSWLFGGVYEILGCKRRPNGGFRYSTRLAPKQDELIGRIIAHHKRTRAPYIWHKPEIALPIIEIRRKKMTIGEFPGYNAVVVTHKSLKIITEQKISSWHGALANIKGVYLITDTTTGRHYVGKASGNSGIWQRWCSYAENGHGGDKETKK